MCRELILQVIEKKKDLYLKLHRLDLKMLEIEEQFAFASDDDLQVKQKMIDDVEVKRLDTQMKLNRTQLFGLRHAKGSEPQCLSCFVEDGDLPKMAQIKSEIFVTYLYKCERCNKELRLAPI